MTKASRNAEAGSGAKLDYLTGRGDPQQAYRLYRLCPCETCEASGKVRSPEPVSAFERCPDCRGEGRTLDLVATCRDAQAVGVALVTLAEEGEFSECPVGLLKDGGSWLISPWLPSPRNVSDAGRILAKSKGEK